MVRVTVLYPQTTGSRFDHDYYVQKHVPMVQNLCGSFGLKRAEVMKGVAGLPSGDASYVCLAFFDFESQEGMAQALGHHAGQIFADIPNYTDIQPQMQVNLITSA